MIKLADDSGSINYCLCAVGLLVSCTVIYSSLVKGYVYTFLVKRYVAHNVHQLLFRTRFYVRKKFIIPNVVSLVTWMLKEF